jgi:transcriptional regulator with XRE-family HTH domain
MTWSEYVTRVAPGTKEAIARAIGVSQATVSRWQKSRPDPANVAAFARAYGRPVLEAFIAAEFLTPVEAGVSPGSVMPSMRDLSDGDLLKEIERRMKEGGTDDAGQAEAQKTPNQGLKVGYDDEGNEPIGNDPTSDPT